MQRPQDRNISGWLWEQNSKDARAAVLEERERRTIGGEVRQVRGWRGIDLLQRIQQAVTKNSACTLQKKSKQSYLQKSDMNLFNILKTKF